MLFPSSVIGSMPRPAFVRDLIWNKDSIPPEVYSERLDAAIRYVVAMQEQAGLDTVTDGEWRRTSYFGVLTELAHGFEVKQDPREGHPPTFTVIDKIRPKKPGLIAEEVKFLKKITIKQIKVCLPSPGLVGERMWNVERSASAYKTRREFVEAVLPILREELKFLERAGVTIVQIDDPYLCLFVDDEVRSQYQNPDEEAAFDVEMVNELVRGFSVKTAVHLCRRAGARSRGAHHYKGDFSKILPQLNQLKANQLTLEFTAPGAGEVSVLKELRPDFEIGLGCVSVHPGQIDSVETIVERVEKALKVFSSERLILNPDCGFSPSATTLVSLNEVYQKLKNEAEAARLLRRRYS